MNSITELKGMFGKPAKSVPITHMNHRGLPPIGQVAVLHFV
jgi:hypothetical protein